jgi:hypothetical protein
MEAIKKNQTEILKPKTTVTKLNNSLESFKNRLGQAAESISSESHHFF